MSQIDFRLGNLTGRLAGMVGASWKGISYIRKMVIPANPNTVAQQGTRTVFSWLVEKGRRINSTILKDYIIPKPKKMSPFNQFIQRNKDMIDAGVVAIEDMVIGKGGLYQDGFLTLQGNTGANVAIGWHTTLQGEALDTDKVIIAVYNITQDVWYFDVTGTRVDETASIETLDLATDDVLHAYVYFVQGAVLSSDTLYETAVAAV